MNIGKLDIGDTAALLGRVDSPLSAALYRRPVLDTGLGYPLAPLFFARGAPSPLLPAGRSVYCKMQGLRPRSRCRSAPRAEVDADLRRNGYD